MSDLNTQLSKALLGLNIGLVPVVVYSDVVQTASVTSGETDGSTFTMAASTLSQDGQSVRIRAQWAHAANTNATTCKVYFNGTALSSFSEATSGAVPSTEFVVTRLTSSTLVYRGLNMGTTNGITRFAGTASAVNFAAAIIIKMSVTGATSNGDLTTLGLTVEWWPVAS